MEKVTTLSVMGVLRDSEKESLSVDEITRAFAETKCCSECGQVTEEYDEARADVKAVLRGLIDLNSVVSTVDWEYKLSPKQK